MDPIRIFISSVQKEFAAERLALRDFLRGDPLLHRFFDVFLFEEVPAKDRRADELYLDEVEKSTVYVGLFGNQYGTPGRDGLSPTHREFLRATELKKHRLIFVQGTDDVAREPKMRTLVETCSMQLVRRRFSTLAELITGVYASLVDYLADGELLRFTPFDAALCEGTGIEDISGDKVRWFLSQARASRSLPLDAETDVESVLSHLRLLRKGQPTNAAILLFGREPQRFIYSSEVKCAHFHGTEVQKPIPSYQVYKGNLFELVDQAVNFVLSKIDRAVGTRAQSVRAPVAYEIPPEVITEAIVNAIAHRDYDSAASVQVMLFADRLEVWNPGTLPPALTLKALLKPHGSYPKNPLIAEPLYLTKYIERMGTGIRDMVERCRAAGLPEPEFKITDGFVVTLRRRPGAAFESVGGVTAQATAEVTAQVTAEVTAQVVAFCSEPRSAKEIMTALGLKHWKTFQANYLNPLLEAGILERTIPDKPQSPLQKYRLTQKGKEFADGGEKR